MLYAVPISRWAALLKLGSALDNYKAEFEKVQSFARLGQAHGSNAAKHQCYT